MTTTIFTEWLKKKEEMSKQNCKILLFMDQGTALPEDTNFFQNVKMIFFTANFMSKLQPLDLRIIK